MQRAGGAFRGTVGAFFMGLTMGIVAAPCVGPIVLGLLLFVGSQQDLVLGLQLFFALGLGMGLPYLLLAMAAGSIRSLPKSGAWLTWVERVFGVLLLLLALHFIRPLLPDFLARWAIPLLLLISGIWLGFVDRSGRELAYFPAFQKIAGVLVLAFVLWTSWPSSSNRVIEWRHFSVAESYVIQEVDRPAILDFVADWCIPCHEMDRTTYADRSVLDEAARFAMFKANLTLENDENAELIERYGVRGMPTIIFLGTDGREIDRKVGYVGPQEMLADDAGHYLVS